jgi:hypothetical protein
LLPEQVRARVRNPPIPAVRHSRRGGQLRGQAPAELRILGAVPHPNIPNLHPQHRRQRLPGSAPCRTSAFDQLVWPGGRHAVMEPGPQLVRRGRNDGKTAHPLARRRAPGFPQSGYSIELSSGSRQRRCRTPRGRPAWSRRPPPSVEGREADLDVLRPMRNQAPAQDLEAAIYRPGLPRKVAPRRRLSLALNSEAVRQDAHRFGRCALPRRRETARAGHEAGHWRSNADNVRSFLLRSEVERGKTISTGERQHLGDQPDVARLRRFRRAMPPACRALLRPRRRGRTPRRVPARLTTRLGRLGSERE